MKDKILTPCTIIPKSLYIHRHADYILRQVIEDMERPGYILVARQMGKTNLLINAKRELQNDNNIFVYLDLSAILGESARKYFQNVIDMAIETNKDTFNKVKDLIYDGRKKLMREGYEEHADELRVLLKTISGKLVIILDEIDALTKKQFSEQIFVQIRSIYYARVNFPEYKRLTYILSGVARPIALIKNDFISPFNIGQEIFLDDFNYDEFLKFLNKAELKLSDDVIKRLYFWANGNPRITWDICSEVETYLCEGKEIGVKTVDDIVNKLYLTYLDKAPIDHIRGLVENDSEIREAIIKLKHHGEEKLSNAIKRKLYLAGIINSHSDPVCIKNKVIEHSLSDQWLQHIEKKEKNNSDMNMLILEALIAPFMGAATQAVMDSYTGLKALVIRKFGKKADIAGALDLVEKKPSKSRQEVLREELAVSGAEKDVEVVEQAKNLLGILKQHGLDTGITQTNVQNGNAIVQSPGAVFASGHGIVMGTVQGNVYTVQRDDNVGQKTEDPVDPAEIKASYCRMVAAACKHLPLLGLDKGTADAASGQKPLCLASIYVDLDTSSRVPVNKTEVGAKGRCRDLDLSEDRNTRPLPALEATIANRLLVLLGDPGGGKSTFVNHLAYCLAAYVFEPEANPLNGNLPGWPDEETLPVIVILRDFARSLPDPLPDKAMPKHLWNFIKKGLDEQNLSSAAGLIEQALRAGRTMVLLDGLDEVPSSSQRLFVRDAVAAFAERYGKCRFLVTCRVLSYQPPEAKTSGTKLPAQSTQSAYSTQATAHPDEQDLRLSSDTFPSFELALFDQEKINNFICAWYSELSVNGRVSQKDVPGLISQLQFAVKSRPDLRLLAPNPLLLTVMAMLHAHNTGRLPDARALLYEETVNMLLWRWEQIKTGGQEKEPRLLQLLAEANRSEVDLKRTLGQLAFEAHGQTGGGKDQDKLAGIGELRLIEALAGLKGGKDGDDGYAWAYRMIKVMKERAGLLIERSPEVFTFPHRTVQEYLAGAHLASQANLAEEVSKLAGQGDLWRVAILLAVGRLFYVSGEVYRPLTLVAELCPKQAGDDESCWRKAWLAGDALLEIRANRASDTELGRELLGRVPERMADLLNKGRLSARERVEVGDSLGRLGDPRLKEGDSKTGPMVEIPGGRFWMGAQKKSEKERNFDQDTGRYGIDESPVHEVELSPYQISKYPVTVGQYQRFMEEGGYEKEDYWKVGGGFDELKDKEPRNWEEQKRYLSRPVVSVSWYEAAAFACWAGGRLPTEAEWERAASGPGQEGQEYRKYPWGNKEPSPEIVNFGGSNIGHVTPVGIFPDGCSPEGVFDLAGNVWEWCWDWYREGYYQLCNQQGVVKDPHGPDGKEKEKGGRVVRGGSFSGHGYGLRCAARDGVVPHYWDFLCGFRVVRGPSF